MSKLKSKWICQECGFQAAAFLGRCTDCGSWGSMIEELIKEVPAGKINERALARQTNPLAAGSEGPIPLKAIKAENYQRLNSGVPSFDEVLGGGIVPGSVILLAGEPGIGKSTLLLQVAKALENEHPLLYISAEESASQVSLRASRLNIAGEQLFIDTEQNVLNICERIQSQQPKLVIIDSIQTIYHPDITSSPGSVSQVRQTAEEIINSARLNNISTIIVGHINKEGAIAGPKVLEHLVDVVLQFEGDKTKELRILRAIKNRFGSTNEIAMFSMNHLGLNEISHAGAFFLNDHLNKMNNEDYLSPGTAVIAYNEGNQTLFLEVQALVGPSVYASPRRVANGWDYNRLLQIIAVLEKKIGLNLARNDVYVNVVGGLDFNHPSGDLGISLAITTSLLDRPVPASLVTVGEIGLTGEIRPVAGLNKIVKETSRLGFKQILLPKTSESIDFKSDSKADLKGLEIVKVEYLQEAFNKVIPNWQDDLRALKKANKAADSKIMLEKDLSKEAERAEINY